MATNFDPLAAAQRAIHQIRMGQPITFEDGPVGDFERDALSAGLPLWFQSKSGQLYLAANASWPSLFKIGCTRRSVDQRMRQLSRTALVTPWLAIKAWSVHDAHGLEAQAHRVCEAWRVQGELFQADPHELAQRIDEVVARDRRRIEQALQFWLPDTWGTPLEDPSKVTCPNNQEEALH